MAAFLYSSGNNARGTEPRNETRADSPSSRAVRSNSFLDGPSPATTHGMSTSTKARSSRSTPLRGLSVPTYRQYPAGTSGHGSTESEPRHGVQSSVSTPLGLVLTL